MLKIFAEIKDSNFLNQEEQIKKTKSDIDGFFIKIMRDNHLLFKPEEINQIDLISQKKLFIFLNIENSENYLDQLILKENSIIAVDSIGLPIEELDKLFKKIDSKKFIPSIAISIDLPIENLIHLPVNIKHLLVLIPESKKEREIKPYMLEKIKGIINFRNAHNLSFKLAIYADINSANLSDLNLYEVDEVILGHNSRHEVIR